MVERINLLCAVLWNILWWAYARGPTWAEVASTSNCQSTLLRENPWNQRKVFYLPCLSLIWSTPQPQTQVYINESLGSECLNLTWLLYSFKNYLISETWPRKIWKHYNVAEVIKMRKVSGKRKKLNTNWFRPPWQFSQHRSFSRPRTVKRKYVQC